MFAQTHKAISVFEKKYPQCQGLFFFDHAPSHMKRPDDALNADRMNVRMEGAVRSRGHICLYLPKFHANSILLKHCGATPRSIQGLIVMEQLPDYGGLFLNHYP